MNAMKLRPHHVLDIISDYGHDAKFVPHPYGHAVHTVARAILSNPNLEVELVIGADEICRPCTHLRPNGLCDDVLRQLDPPISKQQYNDDLDGRLVNYLGLTLPTVMTIRKYLEIVAEHLPGVEKICTHPGEDQETRLTGLQHGLVRLGITEDEEKIGLG